MRGRTRLETPSPTPAPLRGILFISLLGTRSPYSPHSVGRVTYHGPPGTDFRRSGTVQLLHSGRRKVCVLKWVALKRCRQEPSANRKHRLVLALTSLCGVVELSKLGAGGLLGVLRDPTVLRSGRKKLAMLNTPYSTPSTMSPFPFRTTTHEHDTRHTCLTCT